LISYLRFGDYSSNVLANVPETVVITKISSYTTTTLSYFQIVLKHIYASFVFITFLGK